MTQAEIRAGRDEDAEGFIALIGACWAEYPGCILDVEVDVPELRALAAYVAGRDGRLWAAEATGRIVGMIAAYPDGAGPECARTWMVARMYVDRAHRGSGLADRLLDRAEAHAIAAGASRLALLTDTRFERAHRFYERRSYVRSGPLRSLDDLSKTIEFHYAKPVAGVELLGAAGAASAVARLAEILRACVDAGASVSFLPPLAPGTARGFWDGAARAVADGERLVLGGWADGVLVGTVTLDMATPQNQPHRAEIAKLLVHPEARRHGLARALMHQAEREAARAGRSLLTLDTQEGSPAESLYRALGWREAGRIPGYSLLGDGTTNATVIFYKQLQPTGQTRSTPERSGEATRREGER